MLIFDKILILFLRFNHIGNLKKYHNSKLQIFQNKILV